jgi:hypothetical protein
MRHRGAIPESAIDYFGVVSSATGNLMTDLDIFETGTVLLVPLNEWKALYEIANRLRQSEPWRNLTDTDLFALQDPATQQIGLVSVLGNLGEVFAVQLYLPPEGLQFWLQFFRKGTPNPILAQFKLRMLEVSFVPKKALTSQLGT